MLAVQRNTLYLYGGIHETAEREYTLDDFYVLQLDKLERWICMRECKIEGLEWNESDEEDESDSDSDSDDDSSSSSSGEEGEQEGVEVSSLHEQSDNEDEEELVNLSPEERERRRQEKEVIKQRAKEAWGVVKGGNAGAGGAEGEQQRSEEDRNRTPNPGETLRMFFDRTRAYWSSKAFELTQGEARGKEMRTKGFELAEERYEEYKPVLREVERIQREAGLDAEEMRQSAQRAAHGPLGGGVGVESRNRR